MALRITLAFLAVWLSVAVYTAWSGTVLRPVLGPIPFNDPAGGTYTTPVLPRDRYHLNFVFRWGEYWEAQGIDRGELYGELGEPIGIRIRVTDHAGQVIETYAGNSDGWSLSRSGGRLYRLSRVGPRDVWFQARPFRRYQLWASLEGDNQLLEQIPIELALWAQRDDGFYAVFWRAALVGSLAVYAFIFFMLSIPYLGDRVCKWLGRDIDV